MSRCVAFFFLSLLLSGFWISICIPIKIASHQKGVQQRFQKKQNISVRISQTEWEESVFIKAHEMILNGRLFDIQHVQQDAFGVLLFGHYDTKETRLVSLQNKHHGSDHTPGSQHIEIPTILFCEEFPVFHFFNACYSMHHISYYSAAYPSPIKTLSTPPPELCFV